MVTRKSIIHVIAIGVISLTMQSYACRAAAETPPDTYSLQDLETLVIQKDPAVRAADQKLQAAYYQNNEVKWSYGPDINANYTDYPGNGRMDDGDLDTRRRYSIRLNQDLIEFLKIRPSMLREKEAEIQAAEAEKEEMKRQALFGFRVQYLELIEQKIHCSCDKQLIPIYADLVGIFRGRIRHQEALQSELLSAERNLAYVRKSHTAHSASFENRIHFLAEALNIGPETIPTDFHPPPDYLPSAEQLISAVKKNRGEIRRFEANAIQEKEKSSTALFNGIKLSPFAGYVRREDRTTGWESGPEFGVMLTYPLFSAGINKNRSCQSKALETYWEEKAEQFSREAIQALRIVYDRYETKTLEALDAERCIGIKRDEKAAEKKWLEQPTKDIPADQANMLKLEADIIKLEREKFLAQCEKAKGAYELLYMAGFSHPAEVQPAGAAKGGPVNPYETAMWVWTGNGLLDQKEREQFIAFCTSRHISRIFFSLNKPLVQSLPRNRELAEFIAAAHGAGIKVSALLGDNKWVYPKNRTSMISRIEAILSYNTAAAEDVRFDGIHLDIEPHTLKPTWDQGRAELLTRLVETFSDAKKLLQKKLSSMSLEADVPSFYDKADPAVLKKILAVVDGITIMAYETKNAGRIAQLVEAEITAAREAHRFIMIGLNAKEFKSRTEFENLLAAVGMRFSGTPAFTGMAIHDYHHYQSLPEGTQQ